MSRNLSAAAALALSLVVVSCASAQGLPAYVPINPATTARSALYFQPYEDPAPKWRVNLQLDWSNMLEVSEGRALSSERCSDFPLVNCPGLHGNSGSTLVDIEILRLDATLVRDLSSKSFVLLSGGVASAFDGVLDGFINSFHDFSRTDVPARRLRPNNTFFYEIVPQNGRAITYAASDLFLTDLRAGVGLRLSKGLQGFSFITLPTATKVDGFAKGTLSANLLLTARQPLSSRFLYEGSAGLGWTPRHGDLREWQRTVFYSASSGLRWRFSGRQAIYFNTFLQTAGYRRTGTDVLDRSEITGDLGLLLRFSEQMPELVLGLTEDLRPSGPAVDATFRVGFRW